MNFLDCDFVTCVDVAGVRADFKRFDKDGRKRYFVFKMRIFVCFVVMPFFDIFLVRNG